MAVTQKKCRRSGDILGAGSDEGGSDEDLHDGRGRALQTEAAR